MLHLIKYRIKATFGEKTTLFWSVIFSFILTTLMYMAFSGMNGDPDKINTALVMKDNETEAVTLKTTLNMIGDLEDSPLSIKEMSKKEAEKQLKENQISGIFFAGKEAELLVAENGLDQSILQVILEQFQSRVNFLSNIAKEKPDQFQEAVASISQNISRIYVEESTLGGEKPDGFIQYYFAVIAMTCLFAAYMGMDIAMQLQANVRAVGARRMISPTSKLKMFFCDTCTALVIDYVATVFLLCYMKYILKLEIGDDWPGMLAIVFAGCLIGIAIGVWIGSISRIGEGAKAGILVSVGLISSFLSGLMISGIKGIIEQFCPIINRLNPASLITDGFYSITMYPDHARFIRDIFTLGILALILFSMAVMKMRRVRYDSI